MQRHERSRAFSEKIAYHYWRFFRIIFQPWLEFLANLFRPRLQTPTWTNLHHFGKGCASRLSYPRIDEIEAQHTDQSLERIADNP